MHLSLGEKDICWHIHLWLLFIFISCGSLTNTSELHDTHSNNFSPYRGRSYKQNPLCHAGDYSSVNGKTCQDLQGIGSLNSTCLLNSELLLDGDLCLYGTGNLEISAHVSIKCPVKGCYMIFNISGSFKIGPHAVLTASSIAIEAANITLEQYSSINTTSLGGSPPAQTSGTPSTFDRSGGGHGGRGASCTKDNKTNWGGDVYAWSTLSDPWSYGSKGGSGSADMQYGGGGGGRIMLEVKDTLYIDGFVSADGGEGGLRGGGGSGGSILIHALKLKGKGVVSATGGRGWGGGGGGRISLACYSRQDVQVTVHGGRSIGCPDNAGAAGTIFDKTMHSLKVGNHNLTTETETPLLDFPSVMLWSDVFVEDNAKVLVPLLWTRVQVRGQIKLVNGGHISFGLSEFPVSEFELVAEELLMSESVIKVFGAFRMYVKMLLMWDSRILIDGGGETETSISFLEARNLVVLRHKSVICSNAALGVNGQGLLKLSGPGDTIKGQRLFLSLFYNIEIGPGSILQAPLDDNLGSSSIFQTFCPSQTCPMELIAPPDDCHVNSSLPLTVQICRVEDLIIHGMIKGSVLHVHRARTVSINEGGTITASGLGCKNGIGEGKFLGYGAGGGGGHGGKGGSGFFNGTFMDGGKEYGDADFPCELGTGSGGPTESMHVAGGGLIVVGSKKWPLSKLEIFGSLIADGQSREELNKNPGYTATGGIGGGSGGTILLFMQAVVAGDHSLLSTSGGNGSPVGGGGGGGGRVHFHWLDIATGDEYVKIASVNGTIVASGGNGSDGGRHGSSGTVTGSACPEGLFGTFCNECPVGTYKNVIGSDPSLCVPCSLNFLPRRAVYTYVRGGVTQPSCPYKCLSEKYKMPKCYTPLEELVYAFGGPWPFALALSFLLVLLAFLLSALRVKVVGTDHQCATSIHSDGSGSFPYLLSLAQVQGTSKAEETQSHVHRMYFMGPNTFREPWHLPHSPPEAIVGIVYEDAFNRFIDEVNSVAAYEWWQGSVYFIISVVAYPCAWSWKQWCRRTKIHRLQEYVKSEYDHACLRSCRSRALYKGMKVGSTPDLMVAYIDFFLGGDEKHLVVTSTLSQRFPMCIIFGGDGSYMIPYQLQNDTLLSNLIGQLVPPSTWNRFTAGLNAQLRTVRQGTIRSGLGHIISWLNSHGNFQLEQYGVKVEMGWFQATASGYYQLGILVCISEHPTHRSDILDTSSTERSRRNVVTFNKDANVIQQNQPCVNIAVARKRGTEGVNGGKIDEIALKSLDYRRDYLFPFSLLLRNRRPVGLQETMQLLIAFVILADFTITLLMLLQFYWISLVTFFAVLLILPLSLLSTFPAGLNALFSRGHKGSSLARIYALWNVTSLSNILVSFVCGTSYYGFSHAGLSEWSPKWKADRDDGDWWALPTVLLVLKLLQSVFINWHIANLEIQDHSLFSQDPQRFWTS